jgi:N-acetylmuramic acid 6-phosphate etherase
MDNTESLHNEAKNLDTLEVAELLSLMGNETAQVRLAVKSSAASIGNAINDAVMSIKSGGTVLYAGAGTSGRLGVLDASEILPTFGHECFKAVIAGGPDALITSIEGAEDDPEAGAKEALALGPADMALGISASGHTPYVMGFLQQARNRGARTWLMTCNDIELEENHSKRRFSATFNDPDIPNFIQGVIYLPTGPEMLAGSTRLKAGTATKIALNMISTATMIQLGGTYDGLMVDVVPSNIKLVQRAEGIITHITGCSVEEASEALKDAGMRPKVASLMLMKKISMDEAESKLNKCGGQLRKALEE